MCGDSNPNTNSIVPTTRRQCHAVGCHRNWSYSIFMSFQWSFKFHSFKNKLNKIILLDSHHYKLFSMCPMNECHCHRIHRVCNGHSTTRLQKQLIWRFLKITKTENKTNRTKWIHCWDWVVHSWQSADRIEYQTGVPICPQKRWQMPAHSDDTIFGIH